MTDGMHFSAPVDAWCMPPQFWENKGMSILNSDNIAELVTNGEFHITYGGANLTFRMSREYDDCNVVPWEEYDGHGIVSGWETRDKRPGERILANDGRARLFYDIQASIEKARSEGWGLPEEDAKGLTKKQIIAAAVERDFQYCKKWANGEIWWDIIGVVVSMDGEELDRAYLGGIESTVDEKYLENVVGDLVAELETRLLNTAARRICGYAAILRESATNGQQKKG